MIPVFKPKMNKECILQGLNSILTSGEIGIGQRTQEFENRFAEYIGTRYALALNSCTAALHLACLATGIGPGDEVIVPSLSFVSTALAPLYCGATPVFADVDEETLCVDPRDIHRKISPRTKAVIPVHFGGHACQMDEIMMLADEHGLHVIEDAAHACGAKYRGTMLGSIGSVGCFSFHRVKCLTTGDGGMITTNDEELYQGVKKLRWLGIDTGADSSMPSTSYPGQYAVETLGFKYHMNDISAVIGLAQLEVLEEQIAIRRKWAAKYDSVLQEHGWISRPVEREYATSTRYNYIVKVPMRNELCEHLRARGIETLVHYEPAHHFGVFGAAQREASLPVTEHVWTRLLTLPLFPDLTPDDFHTVTREILAFGAERGLGM